MSHFTALLDYVGKLSKGGSEMENYKEKYPYDIIYISFKEMNALMCNTEFIMPSSVLNYEEIVKGKILDGEIGCIIGKRQRYLRPVDKLNCRHCKKGLFEGTVATRIGTNVYCFDCCNRYGLSFPESGFTMPVKCSVCWKQREPTEIYQGINNLLYCSDCFAMEPMGKIFSLIRHERKRQDDKFGKDRAFTNKKWLSILVEEVGEIAKEINDTSEGSLPNKKLETEILQVAAVAVCWLEAILRREG